VGNELKATYGQPWNPNDYDLDIFIKSGILPATRKPLGFQEWLRNCSSASPAFLVAFDPVPPAYP